VKKSDKVESVLLGISTVLVILFAILAAIIILAVCYTVGELIIDMFRH
jgi:hypothetical protein